MLSIYYHIRTILCITEEQGFLLMPRKIASNDIDTMNIEFGHYGFTAQHQQGPINDSGKMTKKNG